MAVFDLFSKSAKRAKGKVPDVWIYDSLPSPFRVQVVHIWSEAFGRTEREGYGAVCPVQSAYRLFRQILCKEYGLFSLTEGHSDAFSEVANFFLQCAEVPQCLDVIQLSFSFIDLEVRKQPYQYHNAEVRPDAAIVELNARFREHGIGYSYEQQRIVRVDSQFIHAEAVKPVLVALSDKCFRGANEEFLKAHALYRKGDLKGAIAECLKAFESTMKVICDRRGWSYATNDTARPLIDVLFKHKLVPDYLQSEFSALRTVLESGVPTLRNRTSGHGQGSVPVELPAFLASYVLHLTASTILFLCEADKNLK
jgi:hypothetical protein